MFFIITVLSASLALIVSFGKSTTRYWLIWIPVAFVLQSLSTAILTAANARDQKISGIFSEEESTDIPAFGLIFGSETDEKAIIYIFAMASWIYNWTLLAYLLLTFGYLWYRLLFVFKKQRNVESASENLASISYQTIIWILNLNSRDLSFYFTINFFFVCWQPICHLKLNFQ